MKIIKQALLLAPLLVLISLTPLPATAEYYPLPWNQNTPTLAMLIDAPATAVEGTIVTLHVRFFNIEPNNVSIRGLLYNGYDKAGGEVYHWSAGFANTLQIEVGDYKRDTFQVQLPTFSDRFSNENSWPMTWTFACVYYSPLLGKSQGFASTATTIVTRADSKNIEINENGLIIQAPSINVEPGETANIRVAATNLLPYDISCIASFFAFDSEQKSGSSSLSPFETRYLEGKITVPSTTTPGTYSYLAGINAHKAEEYQGKSFVAYSTGAIIVEERESSGDLGFDCIIATAAYGSRMNPSVSAMRHLRDKEIGSTFTGHNFVNVFNAWYYSWSPAVADIVEVSEARRSAARIILLPLVLATQASAGVYEALSWSPEAASLAALQCSAILCGIFYIVWPMLLLPKGIWETLQRRRSRILLVIIILSSIAAMFVGQIIGSAQVNSAGIVTLSLTTTLIGASLSAYSIRKRLYTRRLNPDPQRL